MKCLIFLAKAVYIYIYIKLYLYIYIKFPNYVRIYVYI